MNDHGGSVIHERSPTWLHDHRADVFSQGGEDGVIEQILELLPRRDGWCVEFGAWDGRHLSNCANLIVNRAYRGVLIEADRDKFRALQRHYGASEDVVAVQRRVGFGCDDSLDAILRDTPIPEDFDFLSIDIDGNDYHVWRAIERYTPKAVCIEFNPTIPLPVSFVQPADPRVQQGSSLAAITELAKAKGYELICVLPFNAFFVREEFFPRFGIGDNDPRRLWTDDAYLTYLFSGYDGTVFLAGAQRLPWHDLPLEAHRLQRLPRLLRHYRPEYSWARRQAFRVRYRLPARLRGYGREARRSIVTAYAIARGMLGFWRFPEQRDAWAGPFNGQCERLAVFRELREFYDFERIVETGAYRGTTTEFLASTGSRVCTVELDPWSYGFCRARFLFNWRVRVVFGDSRGALRASMPMPAAKAPTFFYLDAHWGDDLPLLEEIDIILSRHADAVIMIDDFAVEGDCGYGFDDYGAGQSLTLDYLRPAIDRLQPRVFFPRAPATEESGAVRGCAVLVGRAARLPATGFRTLRESRVSARLRCA